MKAIWSLIVLLYCLFVSVGAIGQQTPTAGPQSTLTPQTKSIQPAPVSQPTAGPQSTPLVQPRTVPQPTAVPPQSRIVPQPTTAPQPTAAPQSTTSQSTVPTQTLQPYQIKKVPHIEVIAFDSNGDQQVNPKEVESGQDKFLVRSATPAEISKNVQGLFMARDTHFYLPITIQDLQRDDIDKNNVLTANEVDALGIKLATDEGAVRQFVITSLYDSGFAYIKLQKVDNMVHVYLVPTLGSTPVKTQELDLDRY